MAMKLIGQSIMLALWIAAAFAIWHIVSTLVRPVEVVHYDFGLGRKKLKQIPADLSQISEDEIGKRVNLAWDRIEAKLKTLAPRYLDSLLPGASEESIQDVEEILGFPSPVASWLNLPRLLRSFDENFSGYRSVDIVLVYSELSPSLKPRFIRELKSCSSLRQFQWLGDFEPDIANSLTCCKNLSRLRVMNCQDCEILMDTVSSLEHLQVIELVNCDLNAANIEKLKTWTQARLIVLAGTPVDEAQGKDIQAAMPDCFVLAFEFEEKY